MVHTFNSMSSLGKVQIKSSGRLDGIVSFSHVYDQFSKLVNPHEINMDNNSMHLQTNLT